ncbi:MAG: 1-(5-phosphoribosyl)-5-[(5-phosphoribosylamino)methylideneamino] imidazole-4-carboxamide isomerase [Chloroflexota bacterium]
MIVYPAIDLRGGKVVRLKEGDPARMISYSDDPTETARRWLGMGARWLHIVNLDGAFGESDSANRAALESILKLGAQVQFGGGMRSLDGIAHALDLGVCRVVLGTIAVENPDVVTEALTLFGAERIAVGIDARDGLARVRGWKENSGVTATNLALQMRTLRQAPQTNPGTSQGGLRTVIFTDVSRDGLGSGLNIAATKELADVSGLGVIASGGVRTIEDVHAVKKAGLAGVIIGRALYEGTINLKDVLKDF